MISADMIIDTFAYRIVTGNRCVKLLGSIAEHKETMMTFRNANVLMYKHMVRDMVEALPADRLHELLHELRRILLEVDEETASMILEKWSQRLT